MLDSVITRSTSVGVLTACPHEDLAPLMDIIADINDICTYVMHARLHACMRSQSHVICPF